MQGFEKPCINVGKVSIYEIKNVRNFKYHKGKVWQHTLPL